MPGKFEEIPFANINLDDSFFDSLKNDYPEFSEWFHKKSLEGRQALVFYDADGLGAFVSMKEEEQPLALVSGELPIKRRMKISTLRLAERFRGKRLGEGALGLILWKWQESRMEEIYVTVFPKHTDLIKQLERFGFICVGMNNRGENIYLRSRKEVDYSDPYKSFPFIMPNFQKGGYLIVEAPYHDTLFPYSELQNTIQDQLAKDVANGISKVYVGKQWQTHYQVGEPVFIYRKHDGIQGKRFKSCLTSYCMVTDVIAVKRAGVKILTAEQFSREIGNKSVYDKEALMTKYNNDYNVTLIKLLYCGYFGKGKNINMDWLDKNGLWSMSNEYPTNIKLTPAQCNTIWAAGGIDTSNVLL